MYMILHLIIYFVLIVYVHVSSYRYLKKIEKSIIGWECYLGEFHNYILIYIIFKFVLSTL